MDSTVPNSSESETALSIGQARTSQTSRRSVSAKKTWLFRFIAIGLSLLPILILECSLRLFGVGDNTRLIIRAADTAESKRHQFNPAADRAYYGVEDLSG